MIPMVGVRRVIPGRTQRPSCPCAQHLHRNLTDRIRIFCAAALALLIFHDLAKEDAEAAETTAPGPPPLIANLLPLDRVAAWNPGMMSAGGIPNRTVIYRTLSPS